MNAYNKLLKRAEHRNMTNVHQIKTYSTLVKISKLDTHTHTHTHTRTHTNCNYVTLYVYFS